MRARLEAACARDLMEPLRAVLGSRQTVAAAAVRLRSHAASAAPVLLSGRPIGLLTRAQVEGALRHGLSSHPISALVSGGAPRVDPAADLAALHRAALGVAPGVLVARPGGLVLGIVTRHRLDETLERLRRAVPAPPWLSGRHVGHLIDALLDEDSANVLKRAGGLAGAHGTPLYLVGGIVRDLLRGQRGKDLDLVVEYGVGFAEELAQLLGGRITRHPSFGTAVVMAATAQRIDIAIARREIYERPAQLPRVAAGSLLDDLLRRDVTVNSMAVRLDGGDYGRLRDDLAGSRDVSRRSLRVNHALSVLEDPTRAFRVARLGARLGMTISEETRRSLELANSRLAFDALTGERMYRELRLIAQEPVPAAALDACAALDLLRHMGPGLRWSSTSRRWVGRLVDGVRGGLFPLSDPQPSLPLLLLMLLSISARAAQRLAIADRLRIQGEARALLVACGPAVAALLRRLAGPAPPSRIVRICEPAPMEHLAVAWAIGKPVPRRAIEAYLRDYRKVRLDVSGHTLREMGLEPGPRFAKILSQLRDARLDGEVWDRSTERAMIERLMRRRRRG